MLDCIRLCQQQLLWAILRFGTEKNSREPCSALEFNLSYIHGLFKKLWQVPLVDRSKWGNHALGTHFLVSRLEKNIKKNLLDMNSGRVYKSTFPILAHLFLSLSQEAISSFLKLWIEKWGSKGLNPWMIVKLDYFKVISWQSPWTCSKLYSAPWNHSEGDLQYFTCDRNITKMSY